MSYRLLEEIWSSDLNSTDKFVLMRLADHAQDDGTSIYPSNASVARFCSMSLRTVWESIRRLRDSGLLVEVRKANSGGRKTAEYRIDTGALRAHRMCDAELSNNCSRAEIAHVQKPQTPKQILPSTHAEIAHKPLLNPDETLSGLNRYAWQGKIARLNAKDYQEWKARYHAIPDFDADLAGLDDWWNRLHPEGSGERKNWFYAISASLAKAHQRWSAEGRKDQRGGSARKPISQLRAGSPEAMAAYDV
jgi:biotin operon repressor